MWFRNLQLFRLSSPFDMSPEALDGQLAGARFAACGIQELSSTGWVPPLGRYGKQLVHAAGGYVMLCLRTSEKIIPPGVVRQLLDDKVADIEAGEMRTVHRREKQRIRDEIVTTLLPRALCRQRDLYAYLDTRNGLLVVDTASASRAEGLVTRLRSSLGQFPCKPLRTEQSLSAVLTGWLNDAPVAAGFTLGEECELKHPDPAGGVVSCRHQNLSASEVITHIRNGKLVTRLALHWKDRLSCVLYDDFTIRRLRCTDLVREAAGDAAADDPASQFDQDFALMTLELADFITHLLAALGGEEALEPAAGKSGDSPAVRRDRPVPAPA